VNAPIEREPDDDARATLRALVDGLDPLDDLEAEQQLEVMAWIDRGGPLWRTAKPATPPEHLVAYAVLVDPDRRSVLLADHRLAGRWLPTGGHVEPGEHPADAAARELAEELQIEPRPLGPDPRTPMLLTRKPVTNVGESTSHVDVSLWYAFNGATTDAMHPDVDEMAAVRWWPFDHVVHGPGTRFEPHLPRFLTKLVASVTSAAPPATDG
jgi:8-oxo-dGTP diphosphatase